MKKFICVHGHFYQPPRENPWTGEVDVEESAKPFHDWNERIAKECYEANAHAPILNARGETAVRINNYENISFDIGPTLLSWMRRKDPATYKAIVDADRRSALKRGGHGNAMAQVYNHVIMPLASKRDKITQVVWGIRDFEFHYQRKPEGMWLSETAVDRETLKIMAEHGISFTVLSPHQASRRRHIGFNSRWEYLRQESIDPREAYRVILDNGRLFHVFFYDGPISRAIAFQGLLFNGDVFAQRLLSAFSRRERPQLVSTATDGESFGHHHKFGEMALAYASKKIEDHESARLINYGEYLDKFGSHWEVDIHPESSWSCSHGVERWRSDCGCRINPDPAWNQKWRQPLRDALDLLQATVDEIFETQTAGLLKDPWQARNEYIDVMLDPSAKSRARFMSRNGRKSINAQEQAKCWDLLDAEKFSLFMYTSCGWFFDDISGIEPVQLMKFALRATELVAPYTDKDIETPFLKRLADAKSNIPQMGNGADVFNRYVRTSRQSVDALGS